MYDFSTMSMHQYVQCFRDTVSCMLSCASSFGYDATPLACFFFFFSFFFFVFFFLFFFFKFVRL